VARSGHLSFFVLLAKDFLLAKIATNATGAKGTCGGGGVCFSQIFRGSERTQKAFGLAQSRRLLAFLPTAKFA
jgi:hypothetical protein